MSKKIDGSNIRDFCRENNITITKEEDTKDGGKLLYLEECAFNPNHNNGDVKLIITKYNTCRYKCWHDSCKDKKLTDFIKHYQPNYYEGSKNSLSSKQKKIYNLEIQPLDQVEEREAKWILPGYIPRGQVTALCGDGGVGKTFIWCSIVAALSNNTLPAFMFPEKYEVTAEDPSRPFLLFSGEDSTAVVLKKRLREAGANQERILSLGAEDERFKDLEFTSDLLEQLVEKYKPLLCIFDPVQSFVPTDLRMAERNAMRSCTQKLIQLGDKFDCTFIIVVHSNKRPGAFGRSRMSDSSDLWDAARSVLMAGETTESGVFYLSNEKNNYGKLAKTTLYRIDQNGAAVYAGRTNKRDKDYVRESAQNTDVQRSAPARDEAVNCIKDVLKNGTKMSVKELDENVKAMGVSSNALRNAKAKLKEQKILKFERKSEGKGKGVQWLAKWDESTPWGDEPAADIDFRNLELDEVEEVPFTSPQDE